MRQQPTPSPERTSTALSDRPNFWRALDIALIVAALPLSGAATAVLAILAESLWPEAVPSSALAWGVFAAVGSPLLVGGIRLINKGRQLRAALESVSASEDTRPPVLYLRAFGDDAKLASPPQLAQINPFVISTGEENFVEALQGIGPVIAIGRPGEVLPPLGARRLYVDDAEWQARVIGLMGQARLVAFMIGTGSGLWWEVEQALHRVTPERLLFCGSSRDFTAFLNRAHPWLPRPVSLPPPRRLSLAPSEYLLHFDTDGQAHFTRLGNPALLLRGNLRKPMLPVFQFALRPLFEQLGAPWSAPPIPWKALAISVGFLIVLFGGIGLMAWLETG